MSIANDRIPAFFQWLIGSEHILLDEVISAEDGFFAVRKSISSILATVGIETFPDRDDQLLECRNFFDDWYLYAVCDGENEVYSLFKMREQENDKERGIRADGDTPGVTISFIAFDEKILKACLEDPAANSRKRLGIEINRVVAYARQSHHSSLKDYFIRPEANGPYLVAELYTRWIASYAISGILNVPKVYQEIYQKRAVSKKYARIPGFLNQNNRDANSVICDHEKIYLRNPVCLSEHEKLAILATHCGNVSFHSFAAEVRYHAMFLTKLAKVKLPFAGSPYASAVRADMSIGDKEFQGPTPYYDLQSKLVNIQKQCHADV